MSKFVSLVIGNVVTEPYCEADTQRYRCRFAINFLESQEEKHVVFINLYGIPPYLVGHIRKGTGLQVVGDFLPYAYINSEGIAVPSGNLYGQGFEILYQPRHNDSNS